MVHDLLVREIVERNGVAVAAAGRLRHAFRRAVRAAARPCTRPASTLVPSVLSGRIEWVLLHNFVLPVGDVPVGVERCLDAHRHRRAIGLPGEFVVAHPLQPHRLVGHRARQQRRVQRDVVGAVLAVAAGAFHMDAADVLGRHLQRLDQLIAQRKHALRMRPDDHPAVEERRHRAGWPDRAMRQIRLGVGRLERCERWQQRAPAPA